MFGFKFRAHGPTGGRHQPAYLEQPGPVVIPVPPGQQYAPSTDIGPALIPVPAVFAAAWQSNGMIHGAPGTVRQPAPAPFPVLDTQLNAIANTGIKGMPSSWVPFWYPDVYYQTDIPATIAVQTINQSHEMPVPAIRPQAMMVVRATNSPGGIAPGDGAFAARIGGRWPIGWPRIIASYPPTAGLGLKDYGP